MEPSTPTSTELALTNMVRDMTLSNELVNHGVPAAATLSIARLISSGFALDPKSMAIVSTDGKPVADAIRSALAVPGVAVLLPRQSGQVATSAAVETGASPGSWADGMIRLHAAQNTAPGTNPYSPMRAAGRPMTGGSRGLLSGHYTTVGSIWDIA
jgi:hypothetical protein